MSEILPQEPNTLIQPAHDEDQKHDISLLSGQAPLSKYILMVPLYSQTIAIHNS